MNMNHEPVLSCKAMSPNRSLSTSFPSYFEDYASSCFSGHERTRHMNMFMLTLYISHYRTDPGSVLYDHYRITLKRLPSLTYQQRSFASILSIFGNCFRTTKVATPLKQIQPISIFRYLVSVNSTSYQLARTSQSLCKSFVLSSQPQPRFVLAASTRLPCA